MATYNDFEKAPFVPLGEHMTKAKECVALVVPMFEAVRDGDYDGLETLAKKIFKLEHEADEIKDDIRRQIPRTFYLPIYRGDLLAYLKLQDDIADSVEDIAVCLTIKNLPLPAVLEELTFEYVRRVMQTCDYLFECTDQLTTLTDRDFGSDKVAHTHTPHTHTLDRSTGRVS